MVQKISVYELIAILRAPLSKMWSPELAMPDVARLADSITRYCLARHASLPKKGENIAFTDDPQHCNSKARDLLTQISGKIRQYVSTN